MGKNYSPFLNDLRLAEERAKSLALELGIDRSGPNYQQKLESAIERAKEMVNQQQPGSSLTSSSVKFLGSGNPTIDH